MGEKERERGERRKINEDIKEKDECAKEGGREKKGTDK